MYTYGYLFYIPISVILVLLFGVNGLIRKRPFPYYLMAIIAIIYLNKAIEIAIFPIFTDYAPVPEFSVWDNITFMLILSKSNLLQIFLNLLLTLPLGIGIQFVTNLKFKGRLTLLILCGISFELIQLILLFTLKPMNIIFDISDLLCNTIGALLGLFIMRIFNLIFKHTSTDHVKNNIFAYIKRVCSNCANDNNSLDFASRVESL